MKPVGEGICDSRYRNWQGLEAPDLQVARSLWTGWELLQPGQIGAPASLEQSRERPSEPKFSENLGRHPLDTEG